MILKLLHEKPSSAYELLKRLKTLGFSMSPSSLYNLLREMEREGLVKKEGEIYIPLSLPNKDLEGMLRVVEALFDKRIKDFLKKLFQALYEGDVDTVAEVLEKCAKELTSPSRKMY